MVIYEVPKKSAGSFKGLINYLTNSKGNELRVGEISFNNLKAQELNVACIEVASTQKQNTRAKGDKTLHLVISFPVGEKPSKEILKDCEQIIVDELGMSEHQRISVIHNDTDNLHIHVAINKIHPQTKKMYEPYQSHKKLAQACIKCETKYKLTIDNHEFIKPKIENKIEKLEIHRGEEAVCSSIRKLKDKLDSATSWEDFNKILKKQNVAIKVKANGFVFVDQTGTQVKASTVDRNFSKKKLENK